MKKSYPPKPDAQGKVFCTCCDHNGKRKDMQTKELYTCNYCEGTKRRKAPPNYPIRPEFRIVDDFMPDNDDHMRTHCTTRLCVRLYVCTSCGHNYTLPDIPPPPNLGIGVVWKPEYECAQKFCLGTLELLYNDEKV